MHGMLSWSSLGIMETFQAFDNALLNSAGLNRQAIFNVDELPADIADSLRAHCGSNHSHHQLIPIAPCRQTALGIGQEGRHRHGKSH